MAAYVHVPDADVTVILLTNVHPTSPSELMQGVLAFYLKQRDTKH